MQNLHKLGEEFDIWDEITTQRWNEILHIQAKEVYYVKKNIALVWRY